ncbi:hypothetical protein BDW74DRAFT_152918 [Aspergillus multicolor]|uniref:uncharacterized protein n=1 Tax=Aspergillus multicolor TaxID=41759 RepID=UPI003CCCBEA9
MRFASIIAALTLPTFVVPSAISLNNKVPSGLVSESESNPEPAPNGRGARIELELHLRLPDQEPRKAESNEALHVDVDILTSPQNCIQRGQRCCTDPGCARCCGQFPCGQKRNEPYPMCHF